MALLLALSFLVLPSTAAALLAANGAPWYLAALTGTFLLVCIGMGLRGSVPGDSKDTP